jgi:Fe2+ or Zn2+ uptake regulation protein
MEVIMNLDNAETVKDLIQSNGLKNTRNTNIVLQEMMFNKNGSTHFSTTSLLNNLNKNYINFNITKGALSKILQKLIDANLINRVNGGSKIYYEVNKKDNHIHFYLMDKKTLIRSYTKKDVIATLFKDIDIPKDYQYHNMSLVLTLQPTTTK